MESEITATHSIALDAVAAPRLNLALQQNAVPVIRELTITNNSETLAETLTMSVAADPEFIQPRVWPIERLLPEGRIHVEDLAVDLSATFLQNLEEAVRGTLRFTLAKDGVALANHVSPVELLAPDEWSGINDFPEIVAAFVQPNDPAIQTILRAASKKLEREGQRSALDGYHSQSPRRVYIVTEAIWAAVCQQDLTYAVPPASFETNGQKVRVPSAILETRLATCLDTALLFAACLEQAGLNSILVFTRGHAFTACWLQDEDFSQALIDDVQSLRKRIQLKELIAFETTLVTHRPLGEFRIAAAQADKQLQRDDEFLLAVDVKRARMARIRPVYATGGSTYTGEAAAADSLDVAIEIPEDIPEEASLPAREPESRPQTPDARVNHWKRKLLDLSLRNRLLNYRPSKRTIAFMCPKPGLLEDKLAQGAKLKLLPLSSARNPADPRSEDLQRKEHIDDLETETVLRCLERGEIVAPTDEKELSASLVELYRAARAAIQEGGANILYLAAGFLVWKQSEHSERAHKAPLILIPVELTRRSVNSGFRLALHADEPRFNPTLLEMLRQDYGLKMPELEDVLPTEEHGLDVDRIWNIVRRHVRDIRGWEVVEDVVLSTFSFAKYLMWKDLNDRTDLLKESPVVRHLIETPRDPYGSNQGDFPQPAELDEKRHPKDTYLPLPADSSQMAAAIAAAEGKDFVLIGPPGTGKSQTIANMAAQCMAEGKTVLFISEKTAALEVVYRRLREIGLADFCLQLHSNKAKKLEVIEQLGRAWNARGKSVEEWAREADRLNRLWLELNRYVKQLHLQHANGLSVYQAIGSVLKGEAVPRCPIGWPSPDAHTRDELEELEGVADRLEINARTCGSIAGNPLSALAQAMWSPSWQGSLLDAARNLKAHAAELANATAAFVDASRFDLQIDSHAKIDLLSKLHQCLIDAADQPYGFAFADNARELIDDLRRSREHLETYHEAWGRLSTSYKREATAIELDSLIGKWATAQDSWFLSKWLSTRAIRKELARNTDANSTPTDILNDLEQLIIAREHEKSLNDCAHLAAHLGRSWRGLETDRDFLAKAIQWATSMRETLGALCADTTELIALRSAVKQLVCEVNDALAPGGIVYTRGDEFKTCLEAFTATLGEAAELAGRTPDELIAAGGNYFDAVETTGNNWLENERHLHSWCAWQAVRSEALAAGLGPLVEALERPDGLDHSARDLFLVNYCRWWTRVVIDADDVLRTFVAAEHSRRIEQFQQLDRQFMTLTRQYVYAKLCANVPDRASVPPNSEWSILSRELTKKRRHMALRQLISRIPEALSRLAPCVMMSPMSIAQYLPADSKLFDVVLIDEASQIPVWDAIGALARGKQTVVVGDPKQLPPTSFFERREDEDADADVDVEDLESILDECAGANLPARELNWHFRSKAESLITFSNHRYYGGRLVTFPSIDAKDTAVSYTNVPDGIYEKGGARINRGEAAAIVSDIIARLQTRGFDQTVGVVTFNMEQERLIEDLLDEERRKHPEIERFFAEDAVEPVFVKNLESVQGDERDIIYFSITYGPDRSGKVSMNFGPLNQQGGQRRLNVAITRARREMRVYATLRPEQIDLSRTSAEGVSDLKHFLEFAERGVSALGEAVSRPRGTFDSAFEEMVAQRLTAKGWQVHSQIGVSDFRIDLAIVHPDAPGRYLAGVECDGATYHRAATARDRDLLREQVLRRLGWNIIRIWSTDWWIDPAGATDRVDRELRELLAGSQKSKPETLPKRHVEAVEVTPSSVPKETEHHEQFARAVPSHEPEAIEATAGPFYRVATFDGFAGVINPDLFYDNAYDQTLGDLIRHVIDVEAPIRNDVLTQRVARAHGFQRAGRQIRERVRQLIPKQLEVTTEDGRQFLWPEGTSSEEWSEFRRPSGEYARTPHEIPMQELVALARKGLSAGETADTVIEYMTAALGLQRLKGPSRERVARAVALAAGT